MVHPTIPGFDGGELVQTLMALVTAVPVSIMFENEMFINPTLTESFFERIATVKAT
jgi:uncharacterized membrane protein YraQ (UPF0718 family)